MKFHSSMVKLGKFHNELDRKNIWGKKHLETVFHFQLEIEFKVEKI